MKRISFYAVSALVVLTTACGSQNEEVKQFAENFALLVNTNQMDSLKNVYPGAQFDSLAHLATDSITVVALPEDGMFHVSFGDGKWIDVEAKHGHSMTVFKSSGIAAFPEKNLELAFTTGMLNDSLNDEERQALMTDTAYFNWLQRTYIDNGDCIIKITPGKEKDIYNDNWGEAFKSVRPLTLTNLTGKEISASDYSISYNYKEWRGGSENPYTVNQSSKIKGIDLAPHGVGQVSVSGFNREKFTDFKIVPAPGKEDQFVYKYTPTGKEYQEYLTQKN